jgi:hypothetical protein
MWLRLRLRKMMISCWSLNLEAVFWQAAKAVSFRPIQKIAVENCFFLL